MKIVVTLTSFGSVSETLKLGKHYKFKFTESYVERPAHLISGRSGRGASANPSPKFFIFMQFLRKIGQIVC